MKNLGHDYSSQVNHILYFLPQLPCLVAHIIKK